MESVEFLASMESASLSRILFHEGCSIKKYGIGFYDLPALNFRVLKLCKLLSGSVISLLFVCLFKRLSSRALISDKIGSGSSSRQCLTKSLLYLPQCC